MKRIFFYICVVVALGNNAQQNLVPNGDFEDTLICPYSSGQMTFANGWNPYSSSPDYFNSCAATSTDVSVPNNIMGYRSAASGNAYAGIINYVKGESNYSLNREIIGRQLSSPLNIGQKYFASFRVSLAITYGANMATDNLGLLFSTQAYANTDSTTIPPIENFAHINTDSIVTDTVNWTMIRGSFIADSFYTYISIGNFFTNQNTDTVAIVNNPNSSGAYYFIDDIRVSTDSLYTVTNIPSVNPLSFSIYPNPATGIIKIRSANSHMVNTIIVYNVFGQSLFSNEFNKSDRIDLSFLDNGVYNVFIKSMHYQCSTKLIIQK